MGCWWLALVPIGLYAALFYRSMDGVLRIFDPISGRERLYAKSRGELLWTRLA